jgi:Family of unknown function (DUF6101)
MGLQNRRLTSNLKLIPTPRWHDHRQYPGGKTRRGQAVRRQSEFGGAVPAGSSRAWRLDPLALPVRFAAADAAADGHLRLVVLDRQRVVLRRAVRRMRMALEVPLTAYLGVALRFIAAGDVALESVAVSLEHRDPALCVPLYAAPDSVDVLAEWQLWGRVLGLPLLIADRGGNLRDPFRRIGAVHVAISAARRRRRYAIKVRRHSIRLGCQLGQSDPVPTVHRGEREIIART